MCGICGIVVKGGTGAVGEETLRRMCSRLAHRGPDGEGIHVNRSRTAGLGHRRLSIIDIEGGKQPLSNETSDVHAVVNGEIYNFQKMRKSLETRGHRFTTRTDSEVVVHAFEEYGRECLDVIEGMFALAVWDEKKSELLLARDRLGKKPLYYVDDGDRLIFASEIKAILECEGIRRELDTDALLCYLSLGYVPAPLTMFRGIRKLLPGQLLQWHKEETSIERYWLPRPSGQYFETEARMADALFKELHTSVKTRMVSDVPVGALLSGGIDSTIITGLMSLVSKEPVNTFTIGFDEKDYDESDYALAAAKRFNTKHHHLVVKPDALNLLDRIVYHYGEPYADSSAIPMFHLAKFAAEHVKVVLTGDGGDELFLGYPRYGAWGAGRIADKVPAFVRKAVSSGLKPVAGKMPFGADLSRRTGKFIDGLPLSGLDRYRQWIGIFGDSAVSALVSPDIRRKSPCPTDALLETLKTDCPIPDEVGMLAYFDLMTYLPDDLLVKVDVATMAHGLEARCPFLDHYFVALALAIPTESKLRGRTSKAILRQAFKSLLPDEIESRGKKGFGVPIGKWLRHELKDLMEDALLSKLARERGYFRGREVKALVGAHMARKADNSAQLWALLMFEMWHRMFVDRP
jgi:asparagine synthase (glutamine-hydrolysing)